MALSSRVAGSLVFGLWLTLDAANGAAANDFEDRVAIERLSSNWVTGIAARDASIFSLLSVEGRAYYPRIKEFALNADATQLQTLEMVDQLQALFLRLMLDSDSLQAMDEHELLAFAVQHGLIGMDLRASDALKEIVVAGSSAHGRLYKFGDDQRPDRGRQYFAREDGVWRVELRGELERLSKDFAAFAERSGLAQSEAAFFILEMRLMRKVKPADFVPPVSAQPVAAVSKRAPRSASRPQLRLVSVRHSLNPGSAPAATIEDRSESLRYVVLPGGVLPPYPDYRLERVEGDAVVLVSAKGEIALSLNDGDEALHHRLRPSSGPVTRGRRSLLTQAEQGAEREGLMVQWRNVGLRDRPQLLQQAWLTAVHSEPAGPDPGMLGLRVRKLVEGSFWHQLGMQQGDLLTRVNGVDVDSMDAWQRVFEVAENEQSISITVERAAEELSFRTRTIRPR